MRNPYLIEGPAIISFSGGRTSGYMLYHILQAHGGVLPDDVHVCFANTGKEREETLRFVHECQSRWAVNIRWLEWRPRPRRGEKGLAWADRFNEVGYNSASRAGEPFKALVENSASLPNPVRRYCSQELKVRVINSFMRSLGFDKWSNVIGLRGDEMLRVFKAIDRNHKGKERYQNVMPMATKAAGMVTEKMVRQWWAQQPFDLQLKSYEGNCDLCFLKKRGKLARIMRENPGMADWWIDLEQIKEKRRGSLGNQFREEYTYQEIAKEVSTSPLLPMDMDDGDEYDAECGLWCAGDV